MTISNSPIQRFSITNLHGERNVVIDFANTVKILIAENGAGKTTVLNALYNLIAGNFNKLRKTNFSQISVTFSSGREIFLTQEDLRWKVNDAQIPPGIFQHFKAFLPLEHIQEIYDLFCQGNRSVLKASPYFAEARKRMNVDEANLISWIEILVRELSPLNLQGQRLIEARSVIQEEFPFDLIYLPTYRRIEEDLRNLGETIPDRGIDRNFIQFGMSDVTARFNEITSEIKNSSIRWFARVNGQMLTQLITGVNVDDDMRNSLSSAEALRIVLDRVGDNVSPENKQHIMSLIHNRRILDNASLSYFMANLVKVYEQQKENDSAIKKFTAICNMYLVDKEVVYNESSVEIDIVRKKNKASVMIETLSSGEKQIISLFSRLFLEKHRSVAIFFDEPELSLSLEWQKNLLPHIVQSGICGFLFCTTHSPFIFQNDLRPYTSDLVEYITEL
ncbi:AAA family ATPase [Propionivibrio dicarboxylicus]|uniref:AAA domain-containing protein, putative AbiEii toxin, Type IV TA system n=1 Tax=Propionivibrio dicarboxylicus TaxID=83767 RepID=A0A1G7WMF4_9RHOO|nr:AAA family ATPase [Propionivibrio dicarboxylicus]SDG73086.1 AAA domain-containing protein, putative AbiEii toxin, Type IV TA system [Propionivibrio dicarboxylicus]